MNPVDDTTTARFLAECRQSVQDRLARVRWRLRGQLLVEGVAWVLVAAVTLAAVTLICDRLTRPEWMVRATLLILSLAAIIYVAVRRLYQPISLRLNDLDLAELLERRQRGTGQLLTNVLLLPQLRQTDPSASPAMIQAAVRDDFAALQRIDLNATFDEKRRRNYVMLLIGALIPLITFLVASPATASLWARRWFVGAEIRWPQKTYLNIIGLGDAKNLRVPRGEAYLLQLNSQPEFEPGEGYWKLNGRGQTLIIESRQRPVSTQPDAVSLRLILPDSSQRNGTFVHYSGGQFRYELPPLFEPAEFTVTGGDDWFGPIRIEPIDRPSVEQLIITAHTPGRSEPEIIKAGDAEKQLLFLPSTRLELDIHTTQPLTSANIAISGTDEKHALVKLADKHYRFAWEMKEPVTFEAQLQSENGLESKPYFLTLGILNDRPPRLTLRSSGVGRRITPVARVPLVLRAMDDFGIANLSLELEESHLVDAKPVTTSREPLKENYESSGASNLPLDVNRETTIRLGEYSLNPGTTVRIRGKAADACALGVQLAESRWLSFQVVTADELFYEILTRQREQRSRFAKALETAKDQKDSLVKMASSGDAGQSIRTHQAITRQVWQVAVQLDATLQEMVLNELGTEASRDLLQTTVITPLREFHDRAIPEQLKKLSSTVLGDKINEEAREAAIEGQVDLIQQMQRILDKMSQWESFVDVVNQLRHVIQSQTLIRESTEQMQKQQLKDVFEEQN